MARLRLRRPRRGTVVFVEAVLAVAAAAIAVRSTGGYVLAGLAALIGLVFLVRRRGRGLLDVLLDRLRDPGAVDEQGPPTRLRPEFGLATGVLPGLHVAEVATRNGPGLGVIGDGHGFAVLLSAGRRSPRGWDLAELARVLTDDPARPAAAQLLVEQSGPGRAWVDPNFPPTRTYRSLPVRGLPLWNRVLLVIRHEPAWAPETVAARGGGATGARNALAAVAARTVARGAADGRSLRPLDPAEATRLLRELGDPAPGGELTDGRLITATATHIALSVPLHDPAALSVALRTCAELDVDRSVLSVTISAVDHSACAVVRLVDPDPEALDRAAAQLIRAGVATALPDAQLAGLVATLPVGGGARSLADLVNQERT